MKNYFGYAQEETRKLGSWDFFHAFNVKASNTNIFFIGVFFIVYFVLTIFLLHWSIALIASAMLAYVSVYLKVILSVYRLISPYGIPLYGDLKEQFLKTGLIKDMTEHEKLMAVEFIDRKIKASSVNISNYNFFL